MNTTANPVTPAATRMRRHRERVKTGTVLVQFEAAPNGIDRLIERGWLQAEHRHKPEAVTSAFIRMAARALGLGRAGDA